MCHAFRHRHCHQGVWCVTTGTRVYGLWFMVYGWCMAGVWLVYGWCIAGVWLVYGWCMVDNVQLDKRNAETHNVPPKCT